MRHMDFGGIIEFFQAKIKVLIEIELIQRKQFQ